MLKYPQNDCLLTLICLWFSPLCPKRRKTVSSTLWWWNKGTVPPRPARRWAPSSRVTFSAMRSRSSVLTPSPVSSQSTVSRSQQVKAGTEEKLVLHLLHCFSMGDSSFISIFLSTYRSFTSTQRVLDILTDRYSARKVRVIKSLSFIYWKLMTHLHWFCLRYQILQQTNKHKIKSSCRVLSCFGTSCKTSCVNTVLKTSLIKNSVQLEFCKFDFCKPIYFSVSVNCINQLFNFQWFVWMIHHSKIKKYCTCAAFYRYHNVFLKVYTGV